MMTSHKQAGAVIEQLTQMIHVNGIVLRFEHPTPSTVARVTVIEAARA